MIDALANWQWLISPPHREEAVIVDAGATTAGDMLAHGFARVRYFDPSAGAAAPAPADLKWRNEFPPNTLDCVAALNVATLAEGGRRAKAADRLLAAIRESLRTGAGVYAGFESVTWRDAIPGMRFVSGHQRQLLAAGFSDVRAYYVLRSPTQPSDFIPISTRSVRAWDRAVERPGVRSAVRRLLMTVGLHAPFFRYRLLVGRA